MNPYIVAWLKRDEGVKLFPYKDTVDKWSLGIGRNLSDNGISMDEAEYLLANDLERTEAEAKAFPWFDALDDVRQAVVLNMIFNLGIARFKRFFGTIEAIEKQDYALAAVRMGQSAWRLQVPNRAQRLMDAMRTGTP